LSNLLRAGLFRYIKNPLTAIVAVAALLMGILGGSTAVYTIDDMFLIAFFMMLAAFVSLLIGREHGDGGFRNKAVVGHTKGQIFFSEWLLHNLFCFAMLLLFGVGFAVSAHKLFVNIPAGMLCLIILCFLCMTVAVVTLLCVLTFLVSHRAVSAILSVLLIVGLMGASYAIDEALTRPQYYLVEHYNEAGEFVSLQQIEDPRYVDGAVRTLLTHLSYTLPLGQSEPLLEGIAIWNYSNAEVDHDFSWLKIVKFLPLYSMGLTAVFGAIGYTVFRRRDLK